MPNSSPGSSSRARQGKLPVPHPRTPERLEVVETASLVAGPLFPWCSHETVRAPPGDPKSREVTILAAPDPVPPFTAIRSTVLLSALDSLREDHLLERYTRALAPEAQSVLLEGLVPGVWIPLTVTLQHYEACDTLGLSASTQYELGRRTFTRMRGTYLGTAIKLASEAGATPWTLVPHVGRFWARGMLGGAITIAQTGPKDMKVRVLGLPLLRVPYYRNALRGAIMGLAELFVRRGFLHELSEGASPTSRCFRAQWV
jgi:hypothetical protein